MVNGKKHQAFRLKEEIRPKKQRVRFDDELAEQYLPLVHKLAAELFTKIPLNNHVDFYELCSEGYCGLGFAIHSFQEEKSRNSYGYFRLRIWGSMISLLRKADVLSRDDRSMLDWIQNEQVLLEQRLGRLATVDEISKFCHLDSRGVELIDGEHASCNAFDSIDNNTDFDDPNSHELVAEWQHPATLMDRKEQCENLRQAVDQLPDRLRKVIALIFFENMQAKDVAEYFNLTESHICQLKKEGIEILRKVMLSNDRV